MKKLKPVHSEIKIIEAKLNEGISELILYHNQLRNCAKKYNSENYDQIKISNLSDPFKEFKNYKKLYHKETWDELNDEYKIITDGDYFFQYRASFEITSYDDQTLNQKDSENFNWSFFYHYFKQYLEAKNLPDFFYSVNEVPSYPVKRYSRWGVANILAHQKYINERMSDNLWVEKHMDYFDLLDLAKTIPDSEIDEEISKMKKEDEERDRIIKKSWE